MSLLEVNGLNSYYGDSHILFDVSLRVERNEVVALLGRNGAGKTSTIFAVAGVVSARPQSISIDGEEISRLSSFQRVRRGLSVVPSGSRAFPNLTVQENLDIVRSCEFAGAACVLAAVGVTALHTLTELHPINLIRYAGGHTEEDDSTSIGTYGTRGGYIEVGAIQGESQALKAARELMENRSAPAYATSATLHPRDDTTTPYKAFEVGDTITCPDETDAAPSITDQPGAALSCHGVALVSTTTRRRSARVIWRSLTRIVQPGAVRGACRLPGGFRT